MATTHAFGPFRLDVDAEILFRGSEPLPVGKRAVAVLRVLIDRAGAPVSKDTLIDVAWSGLAVEESNLTVQIAALRRVLGVEPGGDKWIETLPRRGYRFVGPVTKGAPVTAADVPGSAPASAPIATAHPEAVDHGRRIEPERRQLTILCCELLLPARAALDPEDLRVIVKNYHQWAADTVDRFNGSIGSRVGTRVLAYFGYPAAHEDDAEQAVRAGLRLCTAVENLASNENVQLRRRVGIATGLVIAGDQAELGDARARAVVGEAPSVAERLQALGQPGTVTIDETTRRLIGNLFQCRDLATTDAETDEAFQVLGSSQVESRFDALRGSPLTPLVGRDEELELVLRRWAETKQGEGRVMVVTGEPGIGKSRLMRAVQERLAAELHDPLIYQCSPHHQDSPLYPVISQLLRAAGIAREDTVDARIEKLATLLKKSGDAKDDEMALLAALMSIPAGDRFPVPPLTPGQLKERTLGALTAWLHRLCGRQPMLFALRGHALDRSDLAGIAYANCRASRRDSTAVAGYGAPGVRGPLAQPSSCGECDAQPPRPHRGTGAGYRRIPWQSPAIPGAGSNHDAHRRRAVVHRGVDEDRAGE